MSKPLKDFESTLAGEMKKPVFREEFLQASSDLEEFLRIRDMRCAVSLSQEQMAGRMRTSQSPVTRTERGRCNGR